METKINELQELNNQLMIKRSEQTLELDDLESQLKKNIEEFEEKL